MSGSNRALLIGSQTGSLTGVHGDVEVMADALRNLHFDVHTIIGNDATAAGIAGSYQELVDATRADDAAVVYYSGHGSRSINPMRRRDPSLPPWLHYIVPTDIDDRSGGVFRGILAEELSEMQRRLTDKCRNVTTILDCCHASRMFRDADAVPKADDTLGFPWAAVAAQWKQVKDRAPAGLGDVNPFAVQVVACEPEQSAYELAQSSIGGAHGALTAALVSILRRPDATQLSWREVIEIVRPAILDVVPTQRPDVLGPQAARLLFSLAEKDTTGVLGVVESDERVWVERASLFGVAEGDSYALVAPTGDRRQPLAVGVVDAVVADRGRLLFTNAPPSPLPAGVLAYPVEVSLGRRPIAVTPADHPDRPLLVEAFRRSTCVRVADEGHAAGVLATLALSDDGVVIDDAQGQPLSSTAQPVTGATVARLDESLTTLARATHVRELESGAGAAELTDSGASVVSVAYSRLDPITKQEIALQTGEHLYVGDAVVIRARNATAETRYLSLLDVGLSGAVAIITGAQPSGATIAAGEEHVVGEDAAHVLEGIPLDWPEGLPATTPRPESVIALIADKPIDGLPALAQNGVRTRGANARHSAIERLIENVSVGRRSARASAPATDETRYRVHRFDFLLHPERRPAGADAPEPVFEIDARPDPTFQLVVPRGAAHLPDRISLRLLELTVHSKRSALAAGVRVDFLVVTSPSDPTSASFVAESRFFDRVNIGDRLPVDNMLIYDGPVGRFLELAVWVAKADDGEVALADLLKAELTGVDVDVATIVRTGARVLSTTVSTSVGVYRTSMLAYERFGAGEPGRRHPAAGVFTTEDMSLAYEVVDASQPGGSN